MQENPDPKEKDEPTGEGVPQTPPTKGPQVKKWLLIIPIALVLAGAGVWAWIAEYSDNPNTTPTPQATSKESVGRAEPTLIYTEKISEVTKDGRTLPTVNVIMRVGSKEPAVLASAVEGLAGSPSGATLSPDRKSLLLNTESELKLLDLGSKKITKLYTPKYQVQSAIFSPDNTKVLLWDQQYAEEGNFQVVEITVKDGIAKTLLDSPTPEEYAYGFSFRAWRSDDKVIMAKITGSEGTLAYYLDLKTQKITQVPGPKGVVDFMLSGDGMILAYPSAFIDDLCNQLSGDATSGMMLIEPVSGNKVSEIVVSAAAVEDVVFSPDNKELLFTTRGVVSSGTPTDAACATTLAAKSYYKRLLSSQSAEEVAGPQEILKKWRSLTLLATVSGDSASSFTITFDNKPWVSSPNALTILAQYYQ
jgi:hypothetical protein